MKNMVRGWWAGLILALVVFSLLASLVSFAFLKGIDNGRTIERQERERQGGGRWIEITLDGRVYQGWVR